MQFGGCHPTDGCQFRDRYDGAKFPFLGAQRHLRQRPARRAAVHGPVLRRRADRHHRRSRCRTCRRSSRRRPSRASKFGDEVAGDQPHVAACSTGSASRRQIVLMHQGDDTEGGGPNDCKLVPGPATAIAQNASAVGRRRSSPAHSHQQYNCAVTDPAGNPRPLIQGLSFGRLLSVVDLKIDKRTRDVVRDETVAHNEIVTRTVTPDPAVQALVDEAKTQVGADRQRAGRLDHRRPRAGRAGRPASRRSATSSPTRSSAATQSNNASDRDHEPGRHPRRPHLRQLAGGRGRRRGDLRRGVRGAAVQQHHADDHADRCPAQDRAGAAVAAAAGRLGDVRILQISSSLHYTWSQSARDRFEGLEHHGRRSAGRPGRATYRVSVNNFLAAGGDGFAEFANGTDLAGGPVDLDAFTAYLTAQPEPGAAARRPHHRGAVAGSTASPYPRRRRPPGRRRRLFVPVRLERPNRTAPSPADRSGEFHQFRSECWGCNRADTGASSILTAGCPDTSRPAGRGQVMPCHCGTRT